MASVTRRVVVTGSESTGKTTLAKALADHYRVPWVPEFAREYAAARGGQVSAADLEPIARGQLGLEARFREAAGSSRLILDTDLLSTWIYALHYYGSPLGWIDEQLRTAPTDLYLLCETDLPWVADPVRDPVQQREAIQALFLGELVRRGLPFERVRGSGSQRLAAAIRAIDTHLKL